MKICRKCNLEKPKDRIKEDYLRVFRFYRFLAQLGFTADKKSMSACREMFNEAYQKTTPERVRLELERISVI
jgi:poly(A) polymerase